MTCRILAPLALLCAFAPSLFAAPTLDIIPQGLQGGNWVWDVQITPDLAIGGGSTPLGIELGFRLTSTPLVSVTNVSPSIFETNNPGVSIFGWETLFGVPGFPEGIEANCAMCAVNNSATFGGNAATVVPGSANEIFAAMGSIDISTPGPVTFLRIIGKGPADGGPTSSTIEWLGAYGGQGRIAQISGSTATNFDIFSGSATQVPEPASVALLAIGGFAAFVRRRSRNAN